MKRVILMTAMVLPMAGCCAISCNNRLPNSYIKVISAIQADCTYEDKLGARKFTAPGEVLGMPKNAPGKLTCQAKGYKPYSKTIAVQDWSSLTPISGDPDAMRYFSEIEMAMEAVTEEIRK
jgi:hypothetical protein